MVFAGSAALSKLALSGALLVLGVFLARIAARGTRVRVQVDTANGELREVIDGAFGAVHTIANYGIDSVRLVNVVSSTKEPSFGQVQLTIEGRGVIPVGDGAVLTLRSLRDRLAHDCGVSDDDAARVAIWTGPLAA